MNQNDKMLARRRVRTVWAFAAAAAATLAAGCGGGGSGDAGSGAADTAAAPAPAAVELSTCGLSNFSTRLLQRINQLRASGANCGSSGQFAPAPAVAWNALLTQAADGHSQDMVAQNYFAHTSRDGRTFAQRIDATGYAWSTAGENIAAGYASVDAVMDGWTQSAGHCANLMNPNFTEIGVACVPGTSSTDFSNYWTMDLARPR